MIFMTQRGLQKMIQGLQGPLTSIHLPNQEALEYPQEHALTRHVQKPYEVRLVNSIRRDYRGLVKFDLIGKYFYSK